MAKKEINENLNTSESIHKSAPKSEIELEMENQRMLDKFVADKKDWVEVTLPKSVGRLIGNPYVASFNGVIYTLEAGKPRRLPKCIAEHIQNIINNAE